MLLFDFVPIYFSSTIAVGVFATALIFTSGIRYDQPEYKALASFSILVTGYQASSFFYHSSEDITQALLWLKVQSTIALAMIPMLFYTFAYWAKHPNIKIWTYFFLISSSIFILINLLSEYSLRFSSVTGLEQVQLWTGESVTRISGEPNIISSGIQLLAMLMMAALIVMIKHLYRSKERPVAILLAVTLFFLLIATVVGFLIDQGMLDFFYIAGVPLLFLNCSLCILGAFTFRTQSEQVTKLSDHTRSLEHSMSELAKVGNVSESNDFYLQMLKSLYGLSHSAYIFIGLLDYNSDNEKIITTKAVIAGGKQSENFSYHLADTPCEKVFERNMCLYKEDVAVLFPKDQLLVDMGVEAYLGAPLLGEGGQLVGLLTLLDTKPFDPPQQLIHAVNIFASRAAAEIRRDATENKLRKMAYVDYTTGLANKVRLVEVIKESFDYCIEQNKEAALIIFDVDRFAGINRDFGYEAGEEVLREISQRLKAYSGDELFFARNGADEFAVLIKQLDDSKTLLNVHKEAIDDLLRRPMRIGSQTLRIALSVGAVIFPSQTGIKYDVIRCAESALAMAKQRGRGCYSLFEPELLDSLERIQSVDAQLRQALLEDSQLSLVYQPKVDQLGVFIGVEALMRWQHPSLGFVSPAEFIPIAERSELIIEVGEWVCNTALTQVVAWRQQGFECKVAINIAATQLLKTGFVEFLLALLERYDLPAHSIEIEITESGLLEDLDKSISILKSLRKEGITIALDDFGTGYSSLSYLRKLPIDVLKIDKSFVDDIDEKSAAELIKSIIGIGQQLSLDTIAEGTETLEQVKKLRHMGCKAFQGYYFSKPIPAEQVPAWCLINPEAALKD